VAASVVAEPIPASQAAVAPVLAADPEFIPAASVTLGGGTPTALLYRVTKRVFDVVLASTLLVALSPLLLALVVLIRLTSRGPAVFRQERNGRGGRTFMLYKFRTMEDGCSDSIHREYVTQLLLEDEPQCGGQDEVYKLAADPRITTVGSFLRRSSLDELPQLLNVINGSMSLVGPRPTLPWETRLFSEAHCRRFDVTPGVTGLWQVSGRNRLTMRQALDLDVEYVEHASMKLDLIILCKTARAVLLGSGAL